MPTKTCFGSARLQASFLQNIFARIRLHSMSSGIRAKQQQPVCLSRCLLLEEKFLKFLHYLQTELHFQCLWTMRFDESWMQLRGRPMHFLQSPLHVPPGKRELLYRWMPGVLHRRMLQMRNPLFSTLQQLQTAELPHLQEWEVPGMRP